MKLLINTASAMQGGSVQVACSFIRELRNFKDDSFGLLLGPGVSDKLKEVEVPDNVSVFPVATRPAQTPAKAYRGNIFDRIEDELKPDVVFTTSGPAYWKSRAPHLIGYNLPHYVYPESPYFQNLPLKERLHWVLWKRLIQYFYNRDADAIVVQTPDVAKRAKQLLRCQDVSVIANTCGSHFFNDNVSVDPLFERQPDKTYLLCLSAYYSHKNLEIFNEVLPLLEKADPGKFKLVLTLPEDQYNLTITEAVQPSVINVGPTPPESCPALYENSDFTILPTLLECFSATYVESMAMGKPILTSDLGFAKSICQDAAVYFDPVDPQSIVEAILSLWRNGEQINKLKNNGFQRLAAFPDARKRAESYIALCKTLVDR